MPERVATTPEHEIGRYICPNTRLPVPLKWSCAVALVEWPLVVKCCPACKQEHEIKCEDLQHPPAYGYE